MSRLRSSRSSRFSRFLVVVLLGVAAHAHAAPAAPAALAAASAAVSPCGGGSTAPGAGLGVDAGVPLPLGGPDDAGGRVLVDFEEDEGGFTGDFESGSTSGVDARRSSVDRVQDDAAAGRGAQRLAVAAATTGGPVEVRLLSHGGEPRLNEAFEPVGRLSLWVQNAGPGPVLVAPIVDDTDGHERGTPTPVPADSAWHQLSWDLADADRWDSFACANGRLDAPRVTLDSFWSSGDGGFVILWDHLTLEDPDRP